MQSPRSTGEGGTGFSGVASLPLIGFPSTRKNRQAGDAGKQPRNRGVLAARLLT